MNIAIYSRKSKFTGKGESIENQIELCLEYAQSHFKDVHIQIYEDEGFTGANTDRPKFKQLMQDIKAKKIDVLMCYRLDRISRNVADFSSTLEMLEKYNVDFVSIKEQFDTSSPMGRAMTYISSVFAQLERETIAERVQDNMEQLAKTGRWLGGTAPVGYESVPVITTDTNGKIRKQFKLKKIPEQAKIVQMLFDKFLELGSVIKLETYLINNDILTVKNKPYNISTLKFILTNPTYAPADKLILDYFTSKNSSIALDKSYDGNYGIMAYNRTNQKKNAMSKNDISKWIISVGEHEPTIPSEKWIEVQTKMQLNTEKSFRKVHSQEALIAGLLRCEKCGSYMRPKRSRMSADGSKYHYYYICELKEKSHGKKCDMKNIPGHTVDAKLIEQLKYLANNPSDLLNNITEDYIKLSNSDVDLSKRMSEIESRISNHESIIDNLLSSLGEAKETIASKYILEKVNAIGNEIGSLQAQLEKLKESQAQNKVSSINLDIRKNMLEYFAEHVDNATVSQKRDMIRALVEKVTWDGQNLILDMLGGKCLGEY